MTWTRRHTWCAALWTFAALAPSCSAERDRTGQAWLDDVTAAPHPSWQIQLTGEVDLSVDAMVYEIDGLDNDAEVVRQLHQLGRHAICYLSAGTLEPWRADADDFPPAVVGRPHGEFPDERWLDVRAVEVLAPIMEERIRRCRGKGFDGVDFDNVDGHHQETGFATSVEDQIAYNRMLADLARRHGLAPGLKNAVDLVPDLVDDFSFAVNEECIHYGECAALAPFVAEGKPVFHLEYDVPLERLCRASETFGLISVRKDRRLGAFRETCPRG